MYGLANRSFEYMVRALLQVGEVLARIAPDVRPGAALDQVLPTTGSTAEVPFDELVRQPNLVALLKHPPSSLMLRGAVHQLGSGDNGPYVFLGSPWVPTAAELVRLGLTLSDFAAHDAASDVTQLAQIHRLAQNDLRRHRRHALAAGRGPARPRSGIKASK